MQICYLLFFVCIVGGSIAWKNSLRQFCYAFVCTGPKNPAKMQAYQPSIHPFAQSTIHPHGGTRWPSEWTLSGASCDILPLDGHYPTNSNDTRLSKETLSRMSSSGARYLVNVKLKCLDIWKSLVLTSSERSFQLSHSPYPYQPYDSGNKTPKALMCLPQKRVQRSSFIEWLNISVGNGTQLKCIILFYYSVITILIAWLVVSKSFNVLLPVLYSHYLP